MIMVPIYWVAVDFFIRRMIFIDDFFRWNLFFVWRMDGWFHFRFKSSGVTGTNFSLSLGISGVALGPYKVLGAVSRLRKGT
jgi:hypothetical protein